MTKEVLGGNYDEAFLAFSLEDTEIIHSSGHLRILMGRGDNQSDLAVSWRGQCCLAP